MPTLSSRIWTLFSVSISYDNDNTISTSLNKIEYMCFKQGAIYTQSGEPLKLVDQFTNLSSNISSTESNTNIGLAKVWIPINYMEVLAIQKNEMGFFPNCRCVYITIQMHDMDANKTHRGKSWMGTTH